MDKFKWPLFIISLLFHSVLFGQTTQEKYASDVTSIDAIIDAYYDVISGSSGDPWQFDRDKFIHSATAIMTRVNENGESDSHSLEAEYIPFLLAKKTSIYEIELNRVVNRFGNIANVWSTYEIRTDPLVSIDVRGINNLQLYYAEGRWWISSWSSEMESDDNPIPAKYLPSE